LLKQSGGRIFTVLPYGPVPPIRVTRDADLAMHPTVKPVAMIADAILDASQPQGDVLDCFAGSGSTLVVAAKTRRIGYGVELDPIYCDVILTRLARFLKDDPFEGRRWPGRHRCSAIEPHRSRAVEEAIEAGPANPASGQHARTSHPDNEGRAPLCTYPSDRPRPSLASGHCRRPDHNRGPCCQTEVQHPAD
jgi:hypothetical protein